MAEQTRARGIGCHCGWPIDGCNPKFAKGEPCAKDRHEAECAHRTTRIMLEAQAEEHEHRAKHLRDAIALLKESES